MPLHPSCKDSVGDDLWVFPTPDWWEYPGWMSRPIQTPDGFQFTLEEVLEFGNKLVGCIGRIHCADARFDGKYICALVRRDDKLVDFTEQGGPFNIMVAPDRPRLTGLRPPPHSDSVVAVGYPRYMGYGNVSVAP